MIQLDNINGIEWSKEAANSLFYGDQIDVYKDWNFSITEKINFADNFWDFSNDNKLHIGKDYAYKYNFKGIAEAKYRLYLKKMVLRELCLKRNRCTSLIVTFTDCKKFVNYLESNSIITPWTIREKDVVNFIQDRFNHVKEKTKGRLLCNLKKFLFEVEQDNRSFNMSSFNKVLNSANINKIKIEIENAKTNNIPYPLFNKIIQVALNNIEDCKVSTLDKMISCMILILSQVGMRRSEAILLETNKIKEIEILNGTKKAYIMEFVTFKTTPEHDGRITETIMTDIALKAYRTLEVLGERYRNNGVAALLPSSISGNFISTSTFGKYIVRFFLKNQHKLELNKLSPADLDLLEKLEVNDRHVKKKTYGVTKDDLGKVIFYAHAHQFRVAVCNEFKRLGVNIQWIKEHMNHLTEEMTTHYFRDNEKDLLKQTLILRANKDGTGLATNADEIEHDNIKGELEDAEFLSAYKEINKFLKKGNLNIFENLDEILKVYSGFPIRESELGYCTKALGKLCERQELLTTLENWYYVRPQVVNISQFDLTYIRFKEKVKIIEHNEKVKGEDTRYMRQYDLEIKSLNAFLQNKLLPELSTLELELSSKLEKDVLINYPNLVDILPQIKIIRKECEEWKKRLSL